MSPRLNLDTTLSGNVAGPIRWTGFITTRELTVCGATDRRESEYYCIRAAHHSGRHRYGTVIRGSFKARVQP